MAEPQPKKVSRLILWVPLALFALFFGVVMHGLFNPAERVVDSKMVGKPLPQFALPAALPGQQPLTNGDFAQGQPRLLNIFASWCIPCKAEAPILEQLARQGVPIDAIAIRDRPEDIAAFLQQYGNPYQRIGSDVDSAVQLAMGSSGVPETFVIDGQGVIRHQHIGDIRPEDIPNILQKLREAQ
ncbi:DsbE family thiol:disulfide interchange protein [Sphingobium boeckii]|uniref:Cytochrome c biogenesis protein CcmG/thiol:disulfide interchange protein DsbE n=1 Tax=Sphingobium boeckii TaxID=1082345 RepID=A0A7W9AKN6_9SPHN|nr:DsbE family thiol:disulfide interchange protein [Sphingobium boeckii]MBB5687420.1 cytochrome c biogenesis protein CcmG/thiol:disulfide interchange protein DsbE [Sphingobium boeckii]